MARIERRALTVMSTPSAAERSASVPKVSVIVGAFSRRDYLRSAVRSVLDQSLGRSEFEIVVVKNFRDPEIDRELEAEGVRCRFDAEPHVGRWLLGAIREARAPLVTFLDDDDLYTPDRLQRLVDIYRRQPDIGYYHNRSTVIDRDGVSIPPERWREHETARRVPDDGWYVPASEKLRGLERLIDAEAGFNLSAMALRRDDAVGPLSVVFEAAEHVTDLPTFLVGLLSPRAIFLDGRRITSYRHHGQNRTMDVGWLEDARADRARLAAAVRRAGSPEYANWVSGLADHFEKLVRIDTIADAIRGRADRRTIARLSGMYLRFLGRHPDERTLDPLTWGTELFAGAYVLLPRWTRRLRLARDGRLDRGRRARGFD